MAVTSDFEGEVIVQVLEAQGIPAHVFSATGRTLSWMVAASDPIRVQVRRRDLELAREALRSTREESVDLDWDEVDVGEPQTPAGQAGSIDKTLGRLAILVLLLMGALLVAAALRSGVP